MNKKVANILIATSMIFTMFISLKLLDLKFVIPESESVVGSLFLVENKNNKNDYVIFEYNKIDYKNYHQGKLFIKKVGCNSGQHLTVDDHRAICDGKVIATMFEKNYDGKLLPKYKYDGFIPSDKFFALGEHIRSFDSRYFGLVEKEQIINSARRIF